MRRNLAAICALFILMLPIGAHAAGISIRDIRVSIDHDEAYTYRMEHRDRMGSESGLLNGSTIRAEILPGSNVTFTFWIENTFPSRGAEINNIVPRLTIEELDDGADVDIEGDEIELEAGEEERIDVKFLIPLDADSTTYDVLIEAEGDNNDTSYASEIMLKMPIGKLSHDIRIKNSFANPEIIECGRKVKLSVEVVNAGSNEETDVSIEFKSTLLGISEREDGIFLESSNEASIDEKTYMKTFDFSVPDSIEPGTYPVLVNVYWKQLALFDQEKINLVVRNCQLPAKNSTNTTEAVVVIANENTTNIQPKRLGNNFAAIAAGGGILVLLIFAGVLKLYKRK